MKLTCPNNTEHKRFIATAHVTEDWFIDETGNFLEVYEGNGGEVIHRPDQDDLFTCAECFTEAIVSK